jgi:hypothetical protein
MFIAQLMELPKVQIPSSNAKRRALLVSDPASSVKIKESAVKELLPSKWRLFEIQLLALLFQRQELPILDYN